MRNDGALPEGPRLGNGSLILKAGKDRAAAQIRVTDDGPPMVGGGIGLCPDRGPGLPVEIARLLDLWIVSGGTIPRKEFGGRVRGMPPARGNGG